jgi:hypothetical protein
MANNFFLIKDPSFFEIFCLFSFAVPDEIGTAYSIIAKSPRYGEILKYEMFLWLLLRERTDF